MHNVHQVGNQPRLYYDARSTNHQDLFYFFITYILCTYWCTLHDCDLHGVDTCRSYSVL